MREVFSAIILALLYQLVARINGFMVLILDEIYGIWRGNWRNVYLSATYVLILALAYQSAIRFQHYYVPSFHY